MRTNLASDTMKVLLKVIKMKTTPTNQELEKKEADAVDLSRALMPHDDTTERSPRQEVNRERLCDPEQQESRAAVSLGIGGSISV